MPTTEALSSVDSTDEDAVFVEIGSERRESSGFEELTYEEELRRAVAPGGATEAE